MSTMLTTQVGVTNWHSFLTLSILACCTLTAELAAQVASLGGGGVISKQSEWVAFPVATTAGAADTLFNADGFEAVSAVGVSFSGGGGAFYSEFLSDNLAVILPLGYGRVGFGAFVQSKDIDEVDSDEEPSEEEKAEVVAETASERFLAAGGNAIFYYALPLVAYDAGFNEGPKTISAQMMFFPRVGLDIPAFNAGTADVSGNLDLGATINLQMLSHNSVFNMFGSFRAGWVAWASDDFYQNLGRQSGFTYSSIEGGVILSDLLRIAVRGAIAGPDELLDRAPVSLSVQLMPLRKNRDN